MSFFVRITASSVVLGQLVTVSAAQDKANVHEHMLDLARSAARARALGDVDGAARWSARYADWRERLGGDDPESWGTQAPGALAGSQLGVPLMSTVPPSCSGTPALASFAGSTGLIADLTTQSFTCTVAGAGTSLWNLDLFLNTDHSYPSDLDVTLRSPAGTTVIVSTDNGGNHSGAFAGTLFSDLVAGDSATDHVYVSGAAAAALSPEGRFMAFRDENPNGVWTLTITDDLGGDFGLLSEFRLDLATLGSAPATSTSSFSKLPGLALVDDGTVSDTQVVAGTGDNLVRLRVRVDVTHTYSADLELRLQSPAGTTVALGTDNGGGFDDVFRGTSFDDDCVDAVTDHAYANLVTATPLGPEGALANFYGEDPNGVWRLYVKDDLIGDVGVLERWDLTIVTCATCSSGVVTYCTTSTTTNGCHPAISANANTASISAGAGSFVLSCSQIEGQKSGLIFYGISGRNNSPWALGSTSTLCVKAPTQRMRTANVGGTAGNCNGTLNEDFFDYVLNFNPVALGNPPAVGVLYDAQAWFRDPPAVKTTNLSDAIEFALCP